MIRVSGRVTYTDNRVDEFAGGINALAAWESYAQRNQLDADPQKSPMTWTLYVAFSALGENVTGRGIGFEKWRENVVDVQLEADDANPTDPAASAT
ncbi:MAG: hypothetical protein ACR2JV_01955 [Gaiellales bacterium]